MKQQYDVVIVGAGVAGLLAAKAAGENGLDVALLEKNPNPSTITRACGQTLISMNEYYFGNLCNYNARDKLVCFSSDGFCFKYDGPYQNLYNLVIVNPDGHKVEFGNHEEQKSKGDLGRIGLAFDKETMFRGLLEEVRTLGVDIMPGVSVDNLSTSNDRVRVEAGGQHVDGSYLIAADGANSRIAQIMGFNENRYYYCNFYALSYYMSGITFPDSDQIARASAFLPEGAARCYVVPRPVAGEHNLIVVSVDPRVDLKAATDYFVERAVTAPWFKKSRKLRTFSAVVNCYSPIVEPYKDRILVVGDAASTQELELTGAMISGWKAGQAIATAVREGGLGLEVKGITQYIDWWKHAYIDYYSYDDFMKGNAFPYILTMEEDLNYVFGLINETLPACWNPYSGLTKQAMRKAMSTISVERPDIYRKLQQRSLPAREILAEITKISKPVL